MPEPEYFEGGWDPEETPDARMEVMGRGPMARKSKTLVPTMDMAARLGVVKAHIRHLYETFRAMHAAHYTVEVPIDPEDESKGFRVVPEVLEDHEIRAKYNSVAKWEAFHQEQVEHYPSVGGFSTKAAMGYDDGNQRRERKQDTSAGTDRSGSRWD